MLDEELAAAIQEIRNRVRARYPEQSPADGGFSPNYSNRPQSLPDTSSDRLQDAAQDNLRTSLQDPLQENLQPRMQSRLQANLMPLLRARDAAEAKVAVIGTVNPRLPGIGNSVIQWTKRKIARAMHWHVREQVLFNQAALDCVQAALDALNQMNAAVNTLQTALLETKELRESADIHVLRSIAEMQASLQHRSAELENSFREIAGAQHGEFTAAIDRAGAEMRRDVEGVIHSELRVLRQRASLQGAATESKAPFETSRERDAKSRPEIDWLKFADVFRGPEEQVLEQQRRYVPGFIDATDVLDIGCGRGEFLRAAREAGLRARGIDQNPECVALCRSRGLDVEAAEMFRHLESLPDASLGGVFCSHVIEHIAPLALPELIQLLGRKLKTGAPIVLETPDPENPETMARHFYADPTHTRPVPARLLCFYLEEAGFGEMVIERRIDYSVSARKR